MTAAVLHVAHLPNATPPYVITPDLEQVQAWLATGTADTVYEIPATKIYPEPEPTPEEPPA